MGWLIWFAYAAGVEMARELVLNRFELGVCVGGVAGAACVKVRQ